MEDHDVNGNLKIDSNAKDNPAYIHEEKQDDDITHDEIQNGGIIHFNLEENADISSIKVTNGTPVQEKSTADGGFVIQKKKLFYLSYDVVIWSIFSLLTILCVIDRFVLLGDVVLERKGKRTSKIIGDNVGESIANIVWGLTARIIIVAQNMMFYTTLWCIPNLIYEFAPSFIQIKGIRDSHIQMHRIIGIFLIGIPSLAHVLVCFVPPIIDKTKITYHPPSEFNYSTQWGHLNWTKFYDPAAVQGWVFNDVYGVHLTSDEIYRFVMVIVLFCVLFPLSRSSFLSNRSYSAAIAIHVFSGIWYSVDNIRKITHGLAHVFNLPFMIVWFIDRLLSIYAYRKHSGDIVSKMVVGDHKYIKIYMKLAGNNGDKTEAEPGIGDIYYLKDHMRFKSILRMERAHPFTSFSNHDAKSKTNGDKTGWDIGFIMTVMDDADQWYPSYTRRAATDYPIDGNLAVWGPYRSSTWQLKHALENGLRHKYVLFCSGSGFGYLLDTLGVLAHKSIQCSTQPPEIDMYYTVRFESFQKAFLEDIELLLSKIHRKGVAKINFHWAITEEKENDADNMKSADTTLMSKKTKGRIDFERIIAKLDKTTAVYFVGRPALADKISEICLKYNIDLVKDHTNADRGVSDKILMVKYLKYTGYVLIVTTFVSVLLAIYLDN